jgi:hypothetical protein
MGIGSIKERENLSRSVLIGSERPESVMIRMGERCEYFVLGP